MDVAILGVRLVRRFDVISVDNCLWDLEPRCILKYDVRLRVNLNLENFHAGAIPDRSNELHDFILAE